LKWKDKKEVPGIKGIPAAAGTILSFLSIQVS
jgi:hypothetical protein